MATSVQRWPTPVAHDAKTPKTDEQIEAMKEKARQNPREGGGPPGVSNLNEVATRWPTPAARDYKGANSADHLEVSKGSLHLDQLPNFVAHLWRTPGAADADRGMNGTWEPDAKAGDHSLRHQSSRWASPTAADAKKSGPKQKTGEGSMPLTGQASLWSTPRASDGEKGGPNQSFGAGGQPLPSQAVQWPTPDAEAMNDREQPETFLARQAEAKAKGINGNGFGVPLAMATKLWVTPRVHEVGNYQYSKGDKSKPTPTLSGQVFSLPDQTRSTDGEMSSTEPRSLNPHFVEWLMAWPPCWTMLASIDFASWGTASSPHKELMLSERSHTSIIAKDEVSSGVYAMQASLDRWMEQMREHVLSIPIHAPPPAQASLFG